MSWAIPTTQTLAQRLAASMLAQQFVAADGTVVRLDPNAPHTLEQVLGVVWTLALSEVYSTIRDQLLEMMVTTATADGLLPQHAKMWGVPRNPAVAAIGSVLVSVGADVELPVGTSFVSDGSVQWLVTAATTIPAGTTAAVSVQANATGTVGNLAAGAGLTLVSPVAGVTAVVVDAQGLAGGAEIEAVGNWRTRIIDRIGNPRGGGTAAEYKQWAIDAGAAYVNVVPGWAGLGTVGIIIAMPGPALPTDAQIAAVQAHIDSVRPVRGNAYVVPARITTRRPAIRLQPDTLQARSQIIAALTTYYPVQGIGGTIYAEAVTNVITTANGYRNTLVTPQADEVLANNKLAVLDSVSWLAS